MPTSSMCRLAARTTLPSMCRADGLLATRATLPGMRADGLVAARFSLPGADGLIAARMTLAGTRCADGLLAAHIARHLHHERKSTPPGLISMIAS